MAIVGAVVSMTMSLLSASEALPVTTRVWRYSLRRLGLPLLRKSEELSVVEVGGGIASPNDVGEGVFLYLIRKSRWLFDLLSRIKIESGLYGRVDVTASEKTTLMVIVSLVGRSP